MTRRAVRIGPNSFFVRLLWVTLVAAMLLAARPVGAEEGSFVVDEQRVSSVTLAPIATGGTAGIVVSRRPTCVQGAYVVQPDGSLGYAVPVIGPTVLRGSQDPTTATSLGVLDLDRLDPQTANTIVACSGMP